MVLTPLKIPDRIGRFFLQYCIKSSRARCGECNERSTAGRTVEILLVEDTPGDIRLTMERAG